MNLGSLLVSNRRPLEALHHLETGVSLSSGVSHSLFNLGYCHLLLGRFKTGWAYYEERFNTGLVPRDCFPSSGPLLQSLEQAPKIGDNSPPLVVWAEQGLGDTIQFVRYLKLLLSLNINFEFHCPASLIPLIRDWFTDSILSQS